MFKIWDQPGTIQIFRVENKIKQTELEHSILKMEKIDLDLPAF